MNFRDITFREIEMFSNEYEDYSVGEILYSGIRLLGLKKLTDLHQISDKEIFTAFNKAREEQRDESIEE